MVSFNCIELHEEVTLMHRLSWASYRECRLAAYYFSIATKCCSLSGGNQNGYVTDLQQGPPMGEGL